ncbi:UDP-glucose dehydrogenase family protein [Manganibacter manganicus]|uniref:UDP-glucose 6-dehydrogenase n=1 Tax=Manganibacter manganicus TaxID=1873176 RepID=A0A1V8RPT8_9HYPH|nr:UDP-glucose/GDP-mannose dehydrogenase family protein [Pseudaminobacter manganicus]OQM75164.1 UDP-glucose 6-dehydrogenase [Pseudaminobacter manganicus]
MKVSVFGTGYVGLVTGACLAEVGHSVICMDVDEAKIDNLRKGILPIWEPGLQEIVERNIEAGHLSFTTDAAKAVRHGAIQMIAVGTPPGEDGSADLHYVFDVADAIAASMRGYRAIITKSTVPVGTSNKVAERITAALKARGTSETPSFDVISNPEFLKEGAAVSDFLKPDRIIVGAAGAKARALMQELYEPFNRSRERIVFMDVESAELTKYAANIMLAAKISVMNEIANVAELVGADIEDVRKGIGSDPRIGYHFIYPGAGYGGSCFPKDVRALAKLANSLGHRAELLEAIENVNNRQKTTLFAKLIRHFGGAEHLRGKTFTVWGLSFKPNTNDMREAPSRTLMEALWRAGANVQAYDPVAMDEAHRIYGERADLKLVEDKYDALNRAEALIVCTEWQQFRAPDFQEMQSRLARKVVIDGRNLYSPARMKADGWSYYSVGRTASDGG